MNDDKWVRRFTVDETHKHKNGFTIYKITSVLFPLASPEAVTVVSVWKRYSDVQRLHKSMQALHSGLHLKGIFPLLSKGSYFRRFDEEVIQERARTIKSLLEFVAEHRLLFTCAEFVYFLQSGYPEPEDRPTGPINAIRSSLHLPIEEMSPLEYQSSDDDSATRRDAAQSQENPNSSKEVNSTVDDHTSKNVDDDTELNISEIEIFEADNVEIRQSPKKTSQTNSLESLNSLDSVNSDFYDELNKITIERRLPSVKRKNVLPDLINFEDQPSTSKFEDYHTMPKVKTPSISSISECTSINSTVYDPESTRSMVDFSRRSSSKQSLCSKKSLTFSTGNLDCKTRTEDSYIFEAGYLLNLAAKCEGLNDYHRAFECYKSGIEKMLIGVQSDTDPERRALVKEKTNKYLSYAETIYRNHLSESDQTQILPPIDGPYERPALCTLPLSMLRRQSEDLSQYRVLAVLASSIMLVLHKLERKCYAMKVIQKIPNNLMEFDGYFLQKSNETKTPILPTNVAYMVPLNSYIETANLIFLILAYAPGEKLFDYIKNYAKSVPNTPAREVNLENVFTDPKNNQNNNQELQENHNNNMGLDTNSDTQNDNIQVSVNELVVNSQRLLLNVDLALSEKPKISEDVVDFAKSSEPQRIVEKSEMSIMQKNNSLKRSLSTRDAIPPNTVCKWGAELLVAIECLHNSGVVCRNLHPNNILLGERGQIILTYFMGYDGLDMVLFLLEKQCKPDEVNLYIAPEIYHNTFLDLETSENGENLDAVCDFWSFGVIMYELICGVPLSYYHRSVFTTHTILQLPEDLPLETQSFLTQLLTYSPAERLGSGKDGIQEIKSHPYFKSIDWKTIYDDWIVPD